MKLIPLYSFLIVNLSQRSQLIPFFLPLFDPHQKEIIVSFPNVVGNKKKGDHAIHWNWLCHLFD